MMREVVRLQKEAVTKHGSWAGSYYLAKLYLPGMRVN
jgi:hypothetical protein